MLRIISLPGTIFVTATLLSILPIPFFLKIVLYMLSLGIFYLCSKFYVLPSLLVPHYEYSNVQQIGSYPDQRKFSKKVYGFINILNIPLIPVVMYLLDSFNSTQFTIFALGWILIGIFLSSTTLSYLLNKKIKAFDVEETVLSRKKEVLVGYWIERIPIAAISILFQIMGLASLFFGRIILAISLYILSYLGLQIFQLSLHNQLIISRKEEFEKGD